MINFERIYYEEDVPKYNLGKELLKSYSNVPKFVIKSHNNIEELRNYENKDFTKLKKYLIIGVRKSLAFKENSKVSDYLVPFTSSGCSAMCMYCYLVCHYNKCSYLRIFVNVNEMLNNLINKSNKEEKEKVYEIGSNSDLILENVITNNLKNVIERFAKEGKGFITFPTKFASVDSILNLNHKGKCIIRMSMNPQYIIERVEFGTAKLDDRIAAINALCEHGYPVGILIAPVILLEDYEKMYEQLIVTLSEKLSDKVKESTFFEIIFMTYSYVHDKINSEAFKNSIQIYDKEKMKKRGRYKYSYKEDEIKEAKKKLCGLLDKYFPNSEIKYIV